MLPHTVISIIKLGVWSRLSVIADETNLYDSVRFPLLTPEAVPNPMLCQQIGRLSRIRLDLAAQPSHVNP